MRGKWLQRWIELGIIIIIFIFTIAFEYAEGTANTSPTFTKGGDVTVEEDEGKKVVEDWAEDISPGKAGEEDQIVHFEVTNNSTPNLFDSPPTITSGGALYFTPASNANGEATITIVLKDDGGTGNGNDTSEPQSFMITVNPVNDPPENTEEPSISGTCSEGEEVTADKGMWNDDADDNPGDLSYMYQWQRADNSEGTSPQDIVGAEGEKYTLTDSDEGKYIRIKVTCMDAGEPGSESTQEYSSWYLVTSSETGSDGENTPPEITEGENKTIDMSEDGSPTLFLLTLHGIDVDSDELTWSIETPAEHGTAEINGAATADSAGINYTPTENYNGVDSFTVKVTDTNGAEDTITIIVNIEAVNDLPVNTAEPTIDGVFHIGGTVTADAGTWNDDADGNGSDTLTYAYQWQIADDSSGSTPQDISGAQNVGYTLTESENNRYVRVGVTCTDRGTPETQSMTVYSSWYLVSNTHPVINQGSSKDVTMSEDGSPIGFELTLSAADTDSDELTWSIALGGEAQHGTAFVSATPTGANQEISYEPDANYNGSDTFTVKVEDAYGGEDTITIHVTINSMNDAPEITEGETQAITMSEDSIPTEFSLTLHGTDADSDELTWSIASGGEAQHGTASVSNTDTGASQIISYEPDENYNGSDNFTVKVIDADGEEDTIIITVNIDPVNDAPSFTLGDNQNVDEDAGTQTVEHWATQISKGPDNESSQALTFNLQTDEKELFTADGQPSVDPETGVLTYTPAENASGTATITVTLEDGGGTTGGGQNSYDGGTFTIIIDPVNDAPSFTLGADQNVEEDAGTQTLTHWATHISPGAENESDQISTLTFNASTDNDGLFMADGQPSIDPETGSLTYTPAENAAGTAIVTVTLQDDGGTANGGQNTSASKTFTITVNPVNDPPEISDIADFHSDEETTVIKTFTIFDVEDDVSDLTLQYDTNNTALIPKGNISLGGSEADRTISFTPVEDQVGQATITIRVYDSKKAVGTETFTVTVDGVNDPPTIQSITDRKVNEETSTGPIGCVIGDVDTEISTLTISATSSDQNLVKDENIVFEAGTGANRIFSITPEEDATGTVTITVTVSDGDDTLPPVCTTFDLEIDPVNDAPIIDTIGDWVILENTSTGAITFNINDIDDEENALVVTASTNNTAMIPRENLVLGGTGGARTITITPVSDKSGTAVINVTVKDDEGAKDATSFILTVNPVNDAPTFQDKGNMTVNEDCGEYSATWANHIDKGAPDEDGQTVAFFIKSNDNEELFTAAPSISSTGVLTFTPKANANGKANITVFLQDSGGTDNGGVDSSEQESFTITVNAVNDSPTLDAVDPITIDEDAEEQSISLAGIAQGGGSDEQTQTLTISAVSDNPSLIFDPTITYTSPQNTGSIQFKPIENVYGSANITVTVDDGQGKNNTISRTFEVTVNPINDVPLATDAEINIDTDEDQSIRGALLASDIDGDPLTYSIVTNGAIGTVTITDSNTGAFEYVPVPNYFGDDTFTFQVNDGTVDSNVAAVTVHITGVNDPPSATGQSQNTDEDHSITGTLVGQDEETEHDSLTYSIVDHPSEGDITSWNEATGEFTYTPHDNFNGIDRFTFRVFDGALYSNTATVTIDVAPVNDKPTATDEEIYLSENQVLHGILKANDVEEDTLTYSIVSNPGEGALVLDSSSTGRYTYTPSENFNGEVSFTFKANDGSSDSDTKTITIHITNVNQPPVIVEGPIFTVGEDSTLTANLTGSDPDGDSITYSIVSGPRRGMIDLSDSDNGAFTYIPGHNYNGQDYFTYKISDGKLFSSIIMAIVNVTPVNDKPEAYGQIIDTTKNQSENGTLVGYDLEGGPLTYHLSGDPSMGTVSVNENGTFVYKPNTDVVGTDSFSFYVTDSDGASSGEAVMTIRIHGDGGTGITLNGIHDVSILEDTTGTLEELTTTGFTSTSMIGTSSNTWLLENGHISTEKKSDGTWTLSMTPTMHHCGRTVVTVTATDGSKTVNGTLILTVTRKNHAPTADNKELEMDQYTQLNEYVTGNDLNGDALTYSKETEPSHGVLDFNSNGTFTYTPSDEYYGTDSFSFIVKDRDNAVSDPATITISIRKVYTAPIVDAGSLETEEDTSGEGILNGSDPHGDDITFQIVNNGSLGTAEITDAETGSFTYTPNANVYGTDTFTFKATGIGSGLESSIETMTVIITPVNDPPEVVVKSYGTDEDQTLTGIITATDIENQDITFELVSNPTKGTMELQENGMFIYTPNENENGDDSFQVKASDGTDDSADTTLAITIRPINDPPSLQEQYEIETEEDTPIIGSLAGYITDVDTGDTHTYERVQNGSKGTLTINISTGEYTYTPNANANGIDYFSFRVKDQGGLYSNIARVRVNITPVNDSPTLGDLTLRDIDEDSTSNQFDFTIGDIEDREEDLTVTAVSDDAEVIPSDRIELGGNGANRWMKITPIDSAVGDVIITVTVADSGKDGTLEGLPLTTSSSITITVQPVNDTPTINGKKVNNQKIRDIVTIQEDTNTGAIAFTVDDEESGGNVTVSAVSNNTDLVDSGGIHLDGVGSNNRTIIVTPKGDQYGTVRITITASDGNTARKAYLDVIVEPVNDAPIVTPPSDPTISEDTSTDALYFTLSDIDNDVEDITMSAISLDHDKVLDAGVTVEGNGRERIVKVIPVDDTNGDVQIRLIADDGEDVNHIGSAEFTVRITPIDDAPIIGTIEDQTTLEDTSTGPISFTVGDIDSDINSLTVSAISGNTSLVTQGGITFGGNGANRWIQIKPKENQNGSGLITVMADDGEKTQSTTFILTVTPVNDPPTISVIPEQTILEGGRTNTITYSVQDIDNQPKDLTVAAASSNESTIPTDQVVLIGNGAERTVKATPVSDGNGDITITLTATDPDGLSADSPFVVHITPINDAPSFTAGADQAADEDAGKQTVSNWATAISRGPDNESDQKLIFTVENNNHDLFSQQPAVSEDGTLTYTSAPDANGIAEVTLTLSDDGGTDHGGVDATSSQTFMITVNAVNDAPSFTAGGEQAVDENAGVQTISNWATGISKGADNESAQTLTFTVTNDNNTLFSRQPEISEDGTLTYTPAPDENGTAEIRVILKDDGGTDHGGVDASTAEAFTIVVHSMNNAPSFTKGADEMVNEDAGDQTVSNWATNISAGAMNESSQELNFIVENNNHDLFSRQPGISEDGTLTYTPAPDEYGSAEVTVILQDDGGTDNGGTDTSTSQIFTITVNAVNDAPFFTNGTDQEINGDAGNQTISNWATGISPGPANESSQILTFTVENDNHSLFSQQPAISTDGTLTYTPALNAQGTATVTVTLEDNGGTANGGANTSSSQNFTITVSFVNHAPFFTKGADETVNEDAGAQIIPNWATEISPGAAGESTQTLIFVVENDNHSLFSQQPVIDADGTLTYTPAPNAYGSVNVTVELKDDGGTANGGADTSASETFTITINPVNDIPLFTKGSDETVNEDAGVQEVSNWATGISSGSANESSQSLTFIVENNNSTLFSQQPAISSDGTLTYTSAPNAHGTTSVTVQLKDDGGTANGGQDISVSQTFTITVNGVNDAPSFTAGENMQVGASTEMRIFPNWVTNISKGPADEEASQTMSKFIVMNDNNELFSQQPTISMDGTLTFTLKEEAYGAAEVTVQVQDNGGTENGGEDTSIEHTFQIKVISKLMLSGTVVDARTNEPVEGATVTVMDLSRKPVSSTTTEADGMYSIEDLTANHYFIKVTHPAYSDNTRMTEVSFQKSEDGIIVEDFLISDFIITLEADPSSILGDGKEKSTLTAQISDRNGDPISGVKVNFSAEKGSFLPETTETTDGDGQVTVQYQSAKLEGTTEQMIPVMVSVNDPGRKLYGNTCIFVAFAPGFIQGVVTDGSENIPVEGAKVKVYKDFNGDGITDFSFTQITGTDGKYKIAIPKGGVDYEIEIQRPMNIGDKTVEVTFKQSAKAGELIGTGDSFESTITATGLVVNEKSDGSSEINTDYSNMRLEIENSDGETIDGLNGNVDSETGVFTAENLDKGTQYKFVIKYVVGEEEIVAGKADVTLTENGELNINTILIDPYGTITDSVSGDLIQGANVELLYADTDRNKAKGLVPGDRVNLPALSSFPPADNANPQFSDENGKYAFMVFPQTDYIITATKSGYENYTSEVIQVFDTIVQYSFKMKKATDDDDHDTKTSNGSHGEEKDLAIEIGTDKMKVQENSPAYFTLKYINRYSETIKDITLSTTIPDGFEPIDIGDGEVRHGKIIWKVDALNPDSIKSLNFSLQTKQLDQAESLVDIEAQITGSEKLSKLEDDYSNIKIMVVSQRFQNHHERYILGYPDGEFKSANSITRAEIATIFYRLLGLENSGGTQKITFSDVPQSHWAKDAIEAVNERGLMGGYGNNLFMPNKAITRDEFAAICGKYFGIDRANTVHPIEIHFKDLQGSWALSTIEEVYRYNIMKGYGNGIFEPNNEVTRAEAVTIINHMLYRGPLLTDTGLFPDVTKSFWAYGEIEEASRTHTYKVNEEGSEYILP